ncbi:hypothetical protein [Paenibacillus sp. FSL H3-0469]|uniref:hypothetical protein n=1 Tax=Paenibacillus sp. FSL H3-0469 TaxID=2954506 RepID=UPI003100C180
MKHVEKISITNARKLGENVEIDFGAGATIILASNGTGKTTIFEAIELALTGQIKRLENSQDAIIRNGLEKMSARLDFSDGKYCRSIYRSGGECEQSGNYDDLFAIENRSSIPYLYRLTHFLEQRSNEWFIDKNDKDAGEFLSQIPLGKELQNILSKRQGLLTAIGKTETTALNSLEEAQKELSEFKELISKRDSFATAATLTPLKEIVANILLISNLIGFEEYKDSLNLVRVISFFEKTKTSFKQEKDNKIDLRIRLIGLKERTRLFFLNQIMITDKQIYIKKYTKKIVEISSFIEETRDNLQTTKDALTVLQNEVRKLNSINSMFEEIEQQESDVKVKKTELDQKEKELIELKGLYESTVKFVKENERIQDQHEFIQNSINEKMNLLKQAESKRNLYEQWNNLSDAINNILQNKIPPLEKKRNDYHKSISQINNEVSEENNKYLMKKSNLESLNEASGAIQEAVSIIKRNLADDEGNCPVCQATYDPKELVGRIGSSLNRLNPAISNAIEEEKEAFIVLEEAQRKLSMENQKLQETLLELSSENDRVEENQKNILQRIQPQFPGLLNPEEAHLYIEEQVRQTTQNIRDLEIRKSQLEPYEDSAKIDNAKLKRNEHERSINEITNIILRLQYDLSALNVKIKNTGESLANERRDAIKNSISSKTLREKELIRIIDENDAVLLKNIAELKQYEDSCLLENESISKVKGIQDAIIAEWEQAGLEGQPNQEFLELKLEILKTSIEGLDKANISLEKIEQELATWRTAEKIEEINNEIKNQIRDLTENAYITSLKSAVIQKDSILQNVIEKRKAIGFFLDNVKLESEKIHEELVAINEPWKGLLKRIVINPMIANAPLLSNKIIRNKLTAKTSALIHNKHINIADIASEAQITDLQLTLLLAMANRYEWTPWKALLLDDPIQHHDLVHASSVFDVLRDYITEYDFQVLMSTHDSTQAKFFHRKLENEGIPSKIYQLVERKGGVRAERIN